VTGGLFLCFGGGRGEGGSVLVVWGEGGEGRRVEGRERTRIIGGEEIDKKSNA